MRIRKLTPENQTKPTGYEMWFSARDTEQWANKIGAAWPGSSLAGRRCYVKVDYNGLLDLTINGRYGQDCSENELQAIVHDHLPDDCKHLWPLWLITQE